MLSLKSLFFDPAESDPESQACDVDARIHVLYDETSKGILSEYIAFCHELDRQLQIHGRKKKAFEEAIRICQERNILKKYLQKRKEELMDIMDWLYNQEELDKECREEERQKALAEGRSQGRAEERLSSIARRMCKLQCDVEQAMDTLDIPYDERAYYAERIAHPAP